MAKAQPDDIKKPLGARVRELRERRGLRQRDLARASGVSSVFLGAVERGEKAASVETIEKVARGLGVDALELFRFSGSSEPAGESGMDLAEQLGRKLVSLARGANAGKLARCERILRAFFEPDDEALRARRRVAGPRRPAPSPRKPRKPRRTDT